MSATHPWSSLQAGPRRAPELARRRARPAWSRDRDADRMARARSLNSLMAWPVSSTMMRLLSSSLSASRAHSLFLSPSWEGAARPASELMVSSGSSVHHVPILLAMRLKMRVQQWWWAAILAWVRTAQRHWVWQSVSLSAPQSRQVGDVEMPH